LALHLPYRSQIREADHRSAKRINGAALDIGHFDVGQAASLFYIAIAQQSCAPGVLRYAGNTNL
jgi:hypothetical protein